MDKYLIPFFGEIPFGCFNSSLFEEFMGWSKQQKYRGKSVRNESIKKYLTLLKTICQDATVRYDWIGKYDPFFRFKMPKGERRAYEKIFPFMPKEQDMIFINLPEHWEPYFQFAFASGISQGEQRAFKPEYIDWSNKKIFIRSAITLNKNGKIVEGPCKNQYRRRTIKLSPKMFNALKKQQKIYEKFNGRYFFCNESGSLIDPSNLRVNVWIPTLQKAELSYRAMIQTRHSFATYHLSKGANPLKLAKIMGHSNGEMVLTVYGKYTDDGTAIED